MRYLWLAEVLRDAGLTVHETSGWKTRGRDSFGPVRGITCHHTAGSRNSTDAGEINILINGRPGLNGPIAQLYLSRDGDWHVIASGHCNHNLEGWAGPNEGYGNDSLLGIEAQHSGGSEPWAAKQYESYVRGVAALVRHRTTWWNVPVSHVAGHKEHQPGAKSDPTFNMNSFRADVAREIMNWNKEWDEMATEAQVKEAARDAMLEVLNDAHRLPGNIGERLHKPKSEGGPGWGEMSDRVIAAYILEYSINLAQAFKAFVDYEKAEDTEEQTADLAKEDALARLEASTARIEASIAELEVGPTTGVPVSTAIDTSTGGQQG